MIAERYCRANCYGMVKSDDYLWIYDSRINSIFQCKDDSSNAQLFINIDDKGETVSQYNQLLEVANKLILTPDRAREIPIINKKNRTIKYINILEAIGDRLGNKDPLIFLNYVVDDDEKYVYLCGYNYPLIIQIDVDDEVITDIIDFSDMMAINTDPKVKFCGYVGHGSAVIEDKLYFPIIQGDALLEYQKKNRKYKVHHLGISNLGYSSILKVDDSIWIQDAGSNRLIILNEKLDIKTEVCFRNESVGLSDNYSLVDGNSKVYIVPKAGDSRKAYYVDKVNLDVCDWDKMNDLIKCDGDRIQIYPVIRIYKMKEIIYFVTGHDLRYHEIDILNGFIHDKYIYLPEKSVSDYYENFVKNNSMIFDEKNIPFSSFLKLVVD